MSMDLVLKPTCGGCGTAGELYGTTCKLLTLCVSCGKTMAENGASCDECGTPITRLIREVMLIKEETSAENGSSPSPVQQATGPVTEDEIRAMLSPKTQVTTLELVAKFKSRLNTKENKDVFAEILKKISKIHTVDGKKIVVLRENQEAILIKEEASAKNGSSPSGPVTEDEIRAVLSLETQVTTLDLVAKFKSRLNTKEGKDAFAEILKKISKIHTVDGKKIVVLGENQEAILIKEETTAENGSSPSPVQATGPVTEDEIRAMLSQKTQVTTRELVAKFKSRLITKEDKDVFAQILKKISKIHTVDGRKIVVLRDKCDASLSLLKSMWLLERKMA